MRNAFADEILKLARTNERIVLLSGDMGNNLFNNFKKEFPSRFINCGAAEANMTGVAAGMALSGLLPVTYSIAAFNPGRCAEQVRLDVCLHNLPVIIAGIGSGFGYASLGPTHHSLEDIAWMRPLPNLAVICPADAYETRESLQNAVAYGGPVYLRLGKKNEPLIHAETPACKIGKSIELKKGGDVHILALGSLASLGQNCAELLEKAGISAGVSSIYSVKPMDEGLLKNLFEKCKIIAVLEDHYAEGGAWSAIAEWLAKNGASGAKLLRFGPESRFYTEGGGIDNAREKCGLAPQKIAQGIIAALG